jgi:hypothetical protein
MECKWLWCHVAVLAMCILQLLWTMQRSLITGAPCAPCLATHSITMRQWIWTAAGGVCGQCDSCL